jgi:hypothetical protein
MTHEGNSLRTSARELIKRHGDAALPYMHDRIGNMRAAGYPRELDQAYRLLSEIERLLKKETA